ncbi:MAG: PIN domain-containing protein [Candidatus Rokubacteria bacterium]|nr:PIN domain-containing protein [Candidatus Rokubacteria bacterium]
MRAVLVDAGPLVALFDRSDRHHERCREALRSIDAPLVSAWPVLTEAMHLLGFSWDAQRALWDLLDSETLALLPLEYADALRMKRLMATYRDLPMDLADAALVRLAEREGVREIFTIDRRDFSLYRPAKIGRFTIVP